MEGFLHWRIQPWLRRLITRALAVVPAAIVAGIGGMKATDQLLLVSQVVLSLQLSFAVVPLVMFTGDRRKMGAFVNPPWVKVAAWTVAGLIAVFNVVLPRLAGVPLKARTDQNRSETETFTSGKAVGAMMSPARARLS